MFEYLCVFKPFSVPMKWRVGLMSSWGVVACQFSILHVAFWGRFGPWPIRDVICSQDDISYHTQQLKLIIKFTIKKICGHWVSNYVCYKPHNNIICDVKRGHVLAHCTNTHHTFQKRKTVPYSCLYSIPACGCGWCVGPPGTRCAEGYSGILPDSWVWLQMWLWAGAGPGPGRTAARGLATTRWN